MKKLTMLMIIFAVLWLAHGVNAALYEGFEDVDGLSVFGGDNPSITVDSDCIDGVGSVKLSFTVPGSGYTYGKIIKNCAGHVNMANLAMSFSVCPVDKSKINSVYIYLYDASGKYEYWRWWSGMSSGAWTTFTFTQGQQGAADGHFTESGFDPKYVIATRFYVRNTTSIAGQTVEAKFDNFQAYDTAASGSARLFVGNSLDGMVRIGEQIGKTQKFSQMLVNTTFEEDSAGTNTWDASGDYGWDEPDIASGINWTQGGSDSQVRVVTSEAYNGDQCGRVIGSSTGSKYAYLNFGNKNNTGTYTMNWYAKHKSISSTSGDRYCYVKIRDDDNDTAAEVQMSKESNNISYHDSSGWHTLMTLVDNTWYEFKLKLNYQTMKFDISARKAGIGASWTTVSNKSFYSSSSTSLDRIYFITNRNKSYSYWDDIVVATEELDKANQTVVYVGRYDDPSIASVVEESGVSVSPSWAGQQGFYIKSFGDDKILVTGVTDVGALYGLMELRDRVQEDGYSVLGQSLNVSDRPVLSVRSGKVYKRANFDIAWYTDRKSPIFRYDSNPEVFNNVSSSFKSDYLATVESNRDKLRSKIVNMAEYGVKVYMATYQPALPEWAIDAFNAYNGTTPSRQTDWWHPSVCPSKQAGKDMLYDKVKNLFENVDNLGGIILNIGENDQCVYSCGCSSCNSQSYKNRLIEYVNIIRDAMLDATGYNPNYTYPDDPDAPKVYLRPWGIISHGLGSDAEFESLANLLPVDVRFRTKLTPSGSDYLWGDTFNTLIDMARMETSGWHAYHPNLNQPCITQLCYTAPKLRTRATTLIGYGVNGQAPCDDIDGTESLYEPSRLASSKIAWDPANFNSYSFLLNWAENRFGTSADYYVAQALKDTYKITDAFTTVDPLHTGWYQMMSFIKDKSLNFYNAGCVLSQTSAVKNVSTGTLSSVLSQFTISDARSVASNAVSKLYTAKGYNSDPDLLRFYEMSQATDALANFYRDYHYAMVYNNLYLNTGTASYRNTASSYIESALPEAEDYVYYMNQLHPKFNDFFEEFNTTWNMGYNIVPSSYYYFGQMSGVDQQVKTGYSHIVMQPLQQSNYSTLVWELQNPSTKIGYKRTGPFVDSDLWPYTFTTLNNAYTSDTYTVSAPGGSLPRVISKWTQPKTLTVNFNADISDGSMLVIKFVPLGCKARNAGDGGLILRKSVQRILLDGTYVDTLVDITTDDAMMDDEFVRYVELPAKSGSSHTLQIQCEDGSTVGVGTEFYTMKLYKGGGGGATLMEGDATGDGHVTATDCMCIAQYVVGTRTLTADQLKCADTTDDGLVTITDALHISQWIVDPTGSLGVLLTPLWESPADDDMLPPQP
ncbi:MAG: dockerin type I repeat-containing protein [Anaerohalosphaeraceae bacterium]|nr:dockerin type I repeat-containing protein [Anaerohalosphaeraceae bacterium]